MSTFSISTWKVSTNPCVTVYWLLVEDCKYVTFTGMSLLKKQTYILRGTLGAATTQRDNTFQPPQEVYVRVLA